MMLFCVYLLTLMFGLMVALSWIRYLVLLVLGFMLTSPPGLGGINGGVTLVTLALLVWWMTLVGASALCLGFPDCSEGGVLGVVLALQASEAIHLGVDFLNVVRQVGRLLDGVRSSRLAELVSVR